MGEVFLPLCRNAKFIRLEKPVWPFNDKLLSITHLCTLKNGLLGVR
jgi:hypothetical protein